MTISATSGWPLQAIAQEVAPFAPGFMAEVVEEIDSTNSELMRRIRAGWSDPVLLVAERQTAGRGRMGRHWQSDQAVAKSEATAQRALASEGRGSLTFSMALPLAPRDWSGLSLAVGVSIASSLHPQLQLKWPNDLWLQDRKLAGILIETASFGELRHAVIGIGINIGRRDGSAMATSPAWLRELLPSLDAPAVLRRIVLPLMQSLRLFETQGFAPFQADFQSRDTLAGRSVVLSDGTRGDARGVDSTGALLVHTSSGMKVITSAEVSVRPAPVGAGADGTLPRN